MTDLTRPNPGDPLASSNGKASTVILDEAFDVIESNEDALFARTSSSVITTDAYTDIVELMVNPAEATTGWHTFNEDIVDANPGPSLDPAHTQGTTSVQAFLKSPTNQTTSRLNVNLTEAGFPTGLDVSQGQNILVDVMLSQVVADGVGGGFNKYSVMIASGTDLSGTTVFVPFNDTATLLEDTWYTITVPVGGLTNIRSIGIKKTGSPGSGSARHRWQLDNIRRAGVTPIDQALNSSTSVGVVVPPDYSSSVTQLPILPSSLKSLVDLRPDHAWISGMGGVRNTREWGLDETGVTDVANDLQRLLDSLSPGTTLEMPPTAVYRCDHGLLLNVQVHINGNGAAIIPSFPTDLYLGLYKNATSEEARIQILEGANGSTIRNLRIYGGYVTQQLGSAFTAAGGASVVGTTMELDALGENASHLNVPGRDHLGRTRQDIYLSDTTHVANDCVITVTDEDGVVLQTQTIPLLTSTPTVYTVYATPRTVWGGHTIKVSKATGTTNKITLQQMRTYNRCQSSFVGYKNPTDPNSGTWEFGHGIQIGNATGITIEDVSIEGATGDGIWMNNSLPTTGNKGNTFRRIFVRGNGRQALAICGGSHNTFEDCYLLYAGRHSVDIEPEFVDSSANDNIYMHNIVSWKCNLVDGFQTSGVNTYARNTRFTIDGLYVYSEFGGGISVGLGDSVMTNVEVYEAGSECDVLVAGRNFTIDGLKVEGALTLGKTNAATSLDTSGAVWTGTNLTAKNVLITKAILGSPTVTTEQIGVHIENLRMSDTVVLDQTYAVMGIQTLPDTTYSNVDLVPHRTLLPNSYPGPISQVVFPSGLDMTTRGIRRLGFLSGGTTRGNNLGRFQQAVSPGSSSFTVAFPSKAYPNVTTTTLSASSMTGTLTPGAGGYHYRLAARNRNGGPVLAEANKFFTLTTATAINILMDNIYDVASGIQIEGVTIYRQGPQASTPVPTTYSMRYDVIPTGDIVWMGGGGSGNNKRISVTDLGTTLSTTSGTSTVFQGYAFPYTGVAGTYTPADETGYEVNTNYAVFVEPSWQTTWRVSARRRDGFDIEFGVPAPAGTNTVSWMIARF